MIDSRMQGCKDKAAGRAKTARNS